MQFAAPKNQLLTALLKAGPKVREDLEKLASLRAERAQARGAHMERTLSDCKKLLLDQEDLRARALRGQALLAKAQSDATRAQHERSIACGRAEALERENMRLLLELGAAETAADELRD